MSMRKVFNLSTLEEVHFMPDVPLSIAVAYCWHDEHNRLSEYFAKVQDGHDFADEVCEGERSVSMDDWSTLK